jgi:subtilisin family serine protease
MGMTVVTAAGNDAQSSLPAPALNSIDSPGTAPSAITVGASTNAHILVGDGVKLAGLLEATIEDVSAVDPTGLACSALPGAALPGTIALIERGNCDFSTKIDNAKQAGAIGVVFYQDPSHPTDLPFGALGAEDTGIPAMTIDYVDGLALQSYLASNSNVPATLNPALHLENALPNLVADFTSHGPSIDYSIKPELVAVGQAIYTATEALDSSGDLYDPTRYTTVQGSSFAAAMVAGAAALVKQANPGFSAAQIKSALVNTASVSPNDIADNSDSGEPLIADVGAGKLNATAALAPGATVAPATVSFGWVGTGLGGDSRAFNGHECRPSRGYLQDFVDARSRHTRSGYERCGECLAGQFTTCGGAAGGCGCYPARWFHRTGHLRRRHRNQRRRH